MTEPLPHLPPGRRAAVEALTQERFGPSVWWETPRPELVDSKLMQGRIECAGWMASHVRLAARRCMDTVDGWVLLGDDGTRTPCAPSEVAADA